MASNSNRANRNSTPGDAAEELRGTIEHVQFASDSGWCVLKVRTDAGVLATVRGTAVAAATGERVHCRGGWVEHQKYGRQFDAQAIQTLPPATPDAIEKYLASGVIDGVGPHYARKLVKHFGAQLPEVLQHNPVYLESVEGIGPERRRRIVDSWQKHANVRDIMMFLHEHGVGPHRAAQIHRRYGDRAVGILRQDPYRLAEDVRGVGFATADQIAARVGIGGDHEKRVEAGLRAVMQRARAYGHCAVPQLALIQQTAHLLDIGRDSVSVSLDRALNSQRLVLENLVGEPLVFLRSLHAAEIAVATHVRRLQRRPPPWGKINVEQRIEAAERRAGLKLLASQFEAVNSLLEHKVCVLRGGPGTGKTTITRVIVDLLSDLRLKIHLCTPTGKASRRLAEATGREAMTIHRLLRGAPGSKEFGHDANNLLDTQVLIVDESPMIDVELMDSLLEALPDDAAVILIGDVDQLPSVGPGQVVHDLIESGAVHVVGLTENRRTAENSSIIRNAHRINRGMVPICSDDPNDDFQWIIDSDVQRISDRVIQLVAHELPRRFGLDPTRDIQALSPMRRGELGTLALSRRLQREIVPNPPAKLVIGDSYFGVGDRLLQLTNYNDLGVFNGDTGQLVAINDAGKTFQVDYDGLLITYDFDQADDVALANPMTVHKAQGSEYPAAVIVLSSIHYPLLSKRLLYTAATRASQRLFLVGDTQAVQIALNNKRNELRCTGLQHRFGLAT